MGQSAINKTSSSIPVLLQHGVLVVSAFLHYKIDFGFQIQPQICHKMSYEMLI